MAVANFFDKAALAAADILREFDLAGFRSLLEQHAVGVAFDDRAASTFEGRVTLELLVNLLARFYPRLAIFSSDAETEPFRRRLCEQAVTINPQIELTLESGKLAAVVSVGTAVVPAGVRAIYVGSRGWTMHISPDSPVGCGDSNNPFAAAAAACFAAANVFRLIFDGQLTNAGECLDQSRSLSLIDLEVDPSEPHDPIFDGVNIGDCTLAGAGAIGNAALWTLARIHRASGSLAVVDPEVVDLSNLQRYVLTTQGDVDGSKVELAAKSLAGSGIAVQTFGVSWANYLATKGDYRLERVIVALDSARDRQVVQGSLPYWVANAWTQPGDLGVSRHPRFGDEACLTCLYFPEGQLKNEDELIADAINLPAEVLTVRNLLHTGAPVGHDFMCRIAIANGIDVSHLARFENEALRTFHSQAVCGGVLLGLGAERHARRGREVPMAFQSALAGVLLAAELVLHATGLRSRTPTTTTRIDLLRPLAKDLSVPVARKQRCICGDADYVRAFNLKWSNEHSGGRSVE